MCYVCTYMLDKTSTLDAAPPHKPRCQSVQYFTYWPVLGCFKNWNIVKFSNKNITSEDFKEIHQVVLDYIGYNMASLVQSHNFLP